MVKTAKSKTVKKKSKIKQNNEINLVEESFHLIKKLNEQVGIVKKSKDSLKDKIEKLDFKITNHEKNTKNQLFTSIKNEIKNDFEPLFKKFNTKSLRESILFEIDKLIELELSKVKSEINSKTNKSKKDLISHINEIEIKVLNSSKKLKEVEKLIKNISLNESEDIFEKINLNILKVVKKENQKFNLLFEDKNKLFENRLVEIEKQDTLKLKKKIKRELNFEIENFKTKIDFFFNDTLNKLTLEKEGIESAISNYVENIFVEFKKIKKSQDKFNLKDSKLFSKYEELFKKENKKFINKFSNFNEKFSDFIAQGNLQIKNISKEKDGLEEFLVKKTNEIISNVNLFENKLNSIEKRDKKFLLNYIEKNYLSQKEILKSDANEIANELILRIDENIRLSSNIIDGNVKNSVKNLEKFKLELSTLIKNYVIEIDKKIKLNSKIEDNKLNLIQDTKEEISKEIFKLNEFSNKTLNEIKENKNLLEEDIENKFLNSKNQFEEIFSTKLSNFDKNLMEKESEFLNKLVIIENDKNLMIEELSQFKLEIGILTKDYVNKLDVEFKKIKVEEVNFEKKKNSFLDEIKKLLKEKKDILEDLSFNLENTFKNLIKEENEKFEIHENTFRDIFNEKILNLQNLQKIKLESIEKKFVDKNLKEVDNRINSQIKTIELVREEFESKDIQLSKKIEIYESKILENFESLDEEKNIIAEKLESRLTGLEKQLNKRFLDYDGDFSNFKTIIIDEVEGLIKDVNNLISLKVDKIDKNIVKSNFINNEITNKILDLNKIHNMVEIELRDIRDDINDIRVKMDIFNYSDLQNSHSLNDHVKYMNEYENQLIALIKNLKTRGVSDDKIAQVLVNKGHPRFYISMILENYNQVLN